MYYIMNNRIEAVRARVMPQLDAQFAPDAIRKANEFKALCSTIMALTEYLDRTMMDMPFFSFKDVEVFGEQVLLIRHANLEFEIFTIDGAWNGVSELANAASEYALDNGLLH